MRDKDVAKIGEHLFPLFEQIIVTGIANPRALDPAEIVVAGEVERASGLLEALEIAGRVTPPEGLIVVAGSLYLVAEVLALNSGW